MISGRGSNTDLMFVEDSASEDDVSSGFAISGARETVLKVLLGDHKIKVNETYRTLYIKDKLSYGGKAKVKFREALAQATEGKNYDEILKKEIIEISPNVIVPLGNLSLRVIANESPVEKFRGSVLPLIEEIQREIPHTVRVIPTLPLQQLMYDFTARVYCSLDLKKAVEARHRTDPIEDNLLIWICKNAEEAGNYFNRIKGAEFVTFDIETFFGIPHCIGFSHNGREGVCMPFLDNRIDQANRTLMLKHIIMFLQSYIPKGNQNVKYDQTILERFFPYINNIVFDTQIAAGTIYSELPKNLGFLTSIYTDMSYFKDEGREFDPKIHNKDRLFIYNAKDAISTWQIADKQRGEIIELGLAPLYYGQGLENKEPVDNPMGMIKLYHIYQRIDKKGILVDEEQRKKLHEKYNIIRQVGESRLRALTEQRVLNINSPKQIGLLIYDELKFPIRRKQSKTTGIQSYDTSEETLEELATFHPNDSRAGEHGKLILETILFLRKIYRILETINTPLHPDNRLRCNYNLSGTENGRTSASKTIDEMLRVNEKGKIERVRLGHSLQTLGKHGFTYDGTMYGNDLRTMYVPAPGLVFVEADLSQAEARVDAVLAEDYEILSRFDDAYGIHRLTASWVYGCSPADISKGTERYHVGKTVRHAAERNMGPNRFALMIQKPLGFCTEVLNKFHATQPKIRSIFHTDVRNAVKKTRLLVAPNGRRRDFFGKLDEPLYNEAISFLPQAIVGDQTKFSMIPFSEENPNFPWLMESHDSVMCELPLDQLESFACRFKRIAERKIDFRTCTLSRDYELTIPVEIQWSDTNWHEMRNI